MRVHHGGAEQRRHERRALAAGLERITAREMLWAMINAKETNESSEERVMPQTLNEKLKDLTKEMHLSG